LVEALRYMPAGCGFDSLGFFNENPSGRTKALGSIQLLTEKVPRDFCWVVKELGE
jgi:hypothetical protein